MQLFRATGGTRLHIPPCPHVLGVGLHEVLPGDERGQPVCSWCEAEISGQGRAYYTTLEDALRAFGSYSETWVPIRTLLKDVAHDQIWITNSRSYVALGLEGQVVAWFGKTYVIPSRGQLVELPGYEGGAGGGSTMVERVGEICPTCFIQMPVTGICLNCA